MHKAEKEVKFYIEQKYIELCGEIPFLKFYYFLSSCSPLVFLMPDPHMLSFLLSFCLDDTLTTFHMVPFVHLLINLSGSQSLSITPHSVEERSNNLMIPLINNQRMKEMRRSQGSGIANISRLSTAHGGK
jgi:hypothetical protein